MSVWEFYDDLRDKVTEENIEAISNCEIVFEEIWDLFNQIIDEINLETQQYGLLEADEQFVYLYFIRNVAYLLSSYKLHSQGLMNPARNLQRTVYEQILRSHLFIKYPDEAQLLYNFVESEEGSNEKEEYGKEIRKFPRSYWSVTRYMLPKLYDDESIQAQKTFYDIASRYSHPHFESLHTDFGVIENMEDDLKVLLLFSFSAIEVFHLLFKKKLTSSLNSKVDTLLTLIGSYVGQIIEFMPNIE
jgi:hypothetical protein